MLEPAADRVQPNPPPPSTLQEGREQGTGKSRVELSLPNMPKAPQFKAWKNKVRTALMNHVPDRASEVLEWINELDKPGVTVESLDDPGAFKRLNVELVHAVVKIVHGDLGREVNAVVDRCHKQNKVPSGRGLLLMIYKDHATNEAAGAMYDITDLAKIKWLGDDKMRTFQNNIDTVLAGCRKTIDEDTLRSFYLDEISKSAKLKPDVAHFRRLPNGHEDKNYNFLKSALLRQLELEREASNRLAQERALGAPDTAYPAGKGGKKDGKGKGKDKDKKGKGKGKDKDGRPRSPSPGGKGKGKDGKGDSWVKDATGRWKQKWMCWHWRDNTCTRGDDCMFQHDANAPVKKPTGAAAAEQGEQAAGQTKAEKKAKRKEKWRQEGIKSKKAAGGRVQRQSEKHGESRWGKKDGEDAPKPSARDKKS